MAKPILQLAALGLVGVALFKVFSFLLVPLLGFILKLALVIGAAFLVVWWLRKQNEKRTDGDAPPEAT